MKQEDIKSLFASFSHMKILVIGDIMLDSYTWGKVERISPEAPVPVVSCTKKEHRLGGAGNVIVNLLSLGAKPVICSIIGNDESGFAIRKILKDLKLEEKGLIVANNRPTTVKNRIISGSQQLIRVDEESDKPMEKELEEKFIRNIGQLMDAEKFDAVIFQDYDKGVITSSVISEVTNHAHDQEIPVLVDPKKRNFHLYKNVTLFKPNFHEFCNGLKYDLAKDDYEGIFQVAKDYQKINNIRYMLITLSDKGILISEGKQYWVLPAQEVKIADVSGAGDTVISVAALCLARKLYPAGIAYISNIAGGLVCEKVGVVPVDVRQLETVSMKMNWPEK